MTCKMLHCRLRSIILHALIPPVLQVASTCCTKVELVSTSHNMLPQLATQMVVRKATLFNLQCNNGGRQVARKCCLFYLALTKYNFCVYGLHSKLANKIKLCHLAAMQVALSLIHIKLNIFIGQESRPVNIIILLFITWAIIKNIIKYLKNLLQGKQSSPKLSSWCSK